MTAKKSYGPPNPELCRRRKFNPDAVEWAMSLHYGPRHGSTLQLVLIRIAAMVDTPGEGAYLPGGPLYDVDISPSETMGFFFGTVPTICAYSGLAETPVRMALRVLVNCGVLLRQPRTIARQWATRGSERTDPRHVGNVYELNANVSVEDDWLPAAMDEAWEWERKRASRLNFASWEDAREALIPEHIRSVITEDVEPVARSKPTRGAKKASSRVVETASSPSNQDRATAVIPAAAQALTSEGEPPDQVASELTGAHPVQAPSKASAAQRKVETPALLDVPASPDAPLPVKEWRGREGSPDHLSWVSSLPREPLPGRRQSPAAIALQESWWATLDRAPAGPGATSYLHKLRTLIDGLLSSSWTAHEIWETLVDVGQPAPLRQEMERSKARRCRPQMAQAAGVPVRRMAAAAAEAPTVTAASAAWYPTAPPPVDLPWAEGQ